MPSTCSTCQAPGQLTVWQDIQNSRVVWHESFSCGCGHAFDAGDSGVPPPAIRQALLEKHGTYEVWLDDAKARPIATKVMTQVLMMQPTQVALRLVKVPARVFGGTLVEAEFVVESLARLGAKEGVRVESARAKKKA